MKHTLHVTETANKAGKYHYQVKDEAGNVISERRSNRVYQACTVNGGNYFGTPLLASKFLSSKYGQGYTANDIAYLAPANN